MIARLSLVGLACATLAACGGDDGDQECVSGDSSRPGLVCSPGGDWIASTNAASTQTGACQLVPGDYIVEYTVVSDTCGIGALATELVTILPGQSLPSESDPAQVPEGCDDSTHQISGCTAAWTRTCLLPTAAGELHATVTYGLNIQNGTATVSFRGQLYDTADRLTESCTSAQTGDINRL